jgi:hypothetical protein
MNGSKLSMLPASVLQLEAEQGKPAEVPTVSPLVEQLRAECSQLQAEVEMLGACLAAAQREGAAQLAEAAARAQAQQQVRCWGPW